ncbi:MAG: ligand-binding sensor domain-containing protein [Clostridium sp.]
MNKNFFSKVLIMFLFVNMLITCSKVNAYDKINFNNISIEEGLSQATVEAIVQDKKGYIWIGTNDGLNRYNGQEFKVYKKEKNNIDKSLIGNYIVSLEEDNEGYLWVGTTSGLTKIDENGKVVKNYTDKEGMGGLLHYSIWDVLITKNGQVIVGTDNGANIYNKEKDSFEPFFKDNSINPGLVYSIDEDKNGDIWLGTKNGVIKRDSKSGAIQKYLHINDVNSKGKRNKIGKVYCDGEYTWIGSFTEGASKIRIDTGEIISLKDSLKDNEGISIANVKSFFRDSNGNMWIGSEKGLFRFNEEKNKGRLYINQVYDKRSIINNFIYTIMEDKTGLIWVGTYSGISTFDISNKIKRYYHDPLDSKSLTENMVQSIYEDEEGYIWVGTNSKGVNILDNDKNLVQSLWSKNNNKILNNNITDITGYKENIFIGTKGGLVWIDKKNNDIKNIDDTGGLISKSIRNLFVDNKKNLWIGTNEGYDILNIETKEITNINYVFEKNNVKDAYSGAVFQDSQGDYWVGSFLNGGLTQINPNTKKVTVFQHDDDNANTIINNSIRVIQEDSKGIIWVGTSGGVSKINKVTGEVLNYTMEDGLPNETIYGLLIDEDDNLWVSTNLGISMFNIEQERFNNLDILDGLQSNEFNGEAYFKSSDGEFLFGGVDGLNAFYPQNITHESAIGEVQFDEFYVNGVLSEYLHNKKFDYKENNIKIKMFLPDYKHNKNTKFYYNFEGKEKSWISLDTNEVLFSNLAAGEYALQFVAVNHKGALSDIKEIKFTITPPFWKSGAAYMIYIAIIILIIFYNKIKVSILDELVNKKTMELREEMDKNKDLYEKVIELEINKNSYFINLSHELRTPLNVLSTTEQLVTTLNKDGTISNEKLDYYMNVIRKNNRRLLNLINNLIDISKMENGKYIIEKSSIDIVYLVEESALSLKEFVEEKGIKLIIDPVIEEKIISCDGDDIERCIINLISNAVKFTPSGGEIKVLLDECRVDNRDVIKISVIDTGKGIDEQFQKVIFNRFNQVVDNHAESHGGSGLGLTITKQIVDLHDGKIYVESKLGEGSSFIIELPC